MLIWQINLRGWNRRRYFIEACWLDVCLVSVHLQAKLPRLSVNHTSHPVRAAKWLMGLEAVPRIACNPVIPPRSELGQPRILRFELKRRDMLHGILVLIPLDSNIVDWLLVQVLQHLRTELVAYFVLHVEVAVELRDHVDWVTVFDGIFLDLLLLFAERENSVFCDVIAVAVG